jgi:hypothetical protein
MASSVCMSLGRAFSQFYEVRLHCSLHCSSVILIHFMYHIYLLFTMRIVIYTSQVSAIIVSYIPRVCSIIVIIIVFPPFLRHIYSALYESSSDQTFPLVCFLKASPAQFPSFCLMSFLTCCSHLDLVFLLGLFSGVC